MKSCSQELAISMATVVQQQQAVLKTNYVEAGAVNLNRVTMEMTGNPTTISKFTYGKVNFYINKSRQYFPKVKFHTFIYFPFHYLVYATIIPFSFFAFLHFIFAFLMAVVNALFLVMYIQHLYVVVTTLRHVVKQPKVPNMTKYDSQHLEISLEVYRAQYATCEQAGIGILVRGSGKVKLQVFSNGAMGLMKSVMFLSCFFFVISLFLIFYCLAFGLIFVV